MLDLDSFDVCHAVDLKAGDLAVFTAIDLGLTFIANFDSRLVAIPLNQEKSIHGFLEVEDIGGMVTRIENYEIEIDPLTPNTEGKLGTLVRRYKSLGRVDKRDSQLPRVLIQDCFLRSSHGSRGFVGRGVGTDRATAAT